MKAAIAVMVTVLTAAVVVLTGVSGEVETGAQLPAEPVAASASGSLQTVPVALPAPLEDHAPEPISDQALDATAPAPPPPEPVAQPREESAQLGQIRDQLAALHLQAADEEARRQAEADQAAAQHAATLEALETLRQAEARLATGDSDGVDDDLGRATAALSGHTRRDVEAAREALARSDLFPARQYLAAALAERRVMH